jgi:hypothetical protein
VNVTPRAAPITPRITHLLHKGTATTDNDGHTVSAQCTPFESRAWATACGARRSAVLGVTTPPRRCASHGPMRCSASGVRRLGCARGRAGIREVCLRTLAPRDGRPLRRTARLPSHPSKFRLTRSVEGMKHVPLLQRLRGRRGTPWNYSFGMPASLITCAQRAISLRMN